MSNTSIAALANVAAYDGFESKDYIDGAPHIKHESLRHLYATLLHDVFVRAAASTPKPKVLDLGAGEGSVTMPFLTLGAKVVAIDISQGQLDRLKTRCAGFQDSLEIRCQDINEALRDERDSYDIVVANSLLHHIPDYLSLIQAALGRLNPKGQFFSFQDPLRYSSLGRFRRMFSNGSYYVWRFGKGDVLAGIQRRLRRQRGVFTDSVHDNTEYHVVRDGVDQDQIAKLCRSMGFECEIHKYFSTQSRLMQPLGAALNLANTFAVIAYR